jgi:hypothetical protein
MLGIRTSSFILPLAVTCVVALQPRTARCAAPEPSAREVAFCEVVSHPDRYDHSMVAFTASVASDGIEHTALFDPACRKRGMALVVRSSVERSTGYQKIWAGIYRTGYIGTLDKHITAHFTGTFLYTPNKSTVRTIVVDSVSQVSVVVQQHQR